eukprot:PhF_6_TR18917/c0_g1_i2/m.27637/K20180/VPS16; vacuolar protein sorting-associated protein 16
MGWTCEEHLCILMEDGTMTTLSMHGKEVYPPLRITKDQVILACVFPTGVALITRKNQLFLVLQTEKEQRVYDTVLEREAACIEVIPSQDGSTSDAVELLIAPVENPKGTVINVAIRDQKLFVTDMRVELGGGIEDLCASPDGRYLAVYSREKGIRIVTTDMRVNKTTLSLGDYNNEMVPHRMLWCGKDIVALLYLAEQFDDDSGSTLILCDAAGDSQCHLRLSDLDDEESTLDVACVTECDGLRVATAKKSFFIQYVPKCIEGIYRMSSEEPASKLVAAFDAYEQQNPLAVQSIRELGMKENGEENTALENAVQDCIEAAGQEYEIEFQKKALRVASYGKCFCKSFEASVFVDMCRKLRVLNAVRRAEVGVPLTLNQLRGLDVQVLVDRLVNRHLHLLAYKICQYLNIKVEKVLVHWACLKVSTAKGTDEDIRGQIVSKLVQCPGVGFAEVAATAFKAGKPSLAIMLLQEEPKAANQVPLLLEMRQASLALTKAIDSGDTDLMYNVILAMRKTHEDPMRFYREVAENPVARDLLAKLSVYTDLPNLGRFYSESGQQHLTAYSMLAQQMKTWSASLRNMRNVKDGKWKEEVTRTVQSFQRTEVSFQSRKDCEWQTKAMKQTEELLLEQRQFADELGDVTFVGSSVVDTIEKLFIKQKEKVAETVRAKYNVSEKKFTWCKLRGLCQIADWDSIDKMGGAGKFNSSRAKSPIGFVPFITELMKAGRIEQARQYVPKLPEIHDRMEHWVLLGDMHNAIEDAAKAENLEMLQQLRTKVTNPGHAATIDKYMESLSS